MSAASSIVYVGVESFDQLFLEAKWPLALDTYQRGFVWNQEKVGQLAEDLHEYQKQSNSKPPYYMGSILIHEHEARPKKQYIIDGQQRLTALAVLHHCLQDQLPKNFELTYSPKSAKQIRLAAEVFKKGVKPGSEIFGQIVFTVIRVKCVDLAFTFFDTQNNRGVPLHATDLLKAYHLRAIDCTDTCHKEGLQTVCAKRWEGIQQGEPVMSHEQEFAPSLFSKFLWRARYWTGSRVKPGGHDALMAEFQKEACKSNGRFDTIPLYRSRNNRLGTSLTMNAQGYSEICGSAISLSPEAESLPFAVRQPIHKGIGFFLYADKYAALLRDLVFSHSTDKEILEFRKVYHQLVMANSVYLREIFLLASLMYVDQFGHEKLWEFALWLEHALGAIRLDKQQVRYEAAQNFLKNAEQNFLDVIANAYLPDQVIGFLEKNPTHQKIHEEEQIEVGKGVQGYYKQAVLAYYGHDSATALGGKVTWIKNKLEGVRHEDYV